MRVQTYTSQVQIPQTSGNALASDIGGLTNTGQDKVWEAVGNIGQVVQELGRRKQVADDLLASNTVTLARQDMANKFEDFKVNNPDPSKWEAEAIRLSAESDNTFNNQRFSGHTKKQEQLKQQGANSDFLSQVRLQTTVKTAENAIIATESTYKLDSLNIPLPPTSKDFTDPSYKAYDVYMAKVEDSQNAYKKALSNKYSPEVADTLFKNAQIEADALTLKSQVTNLASLGRYDEAENLATSRSSGLLTPMERESLLNSITTMRTRAFKQNEFISNASEKEILKTTSEEQFNLSPEERGAKADAMKAFIFDDKNGIIDGTKRGYWLKVVDDWENKIYQDDPNVIAKMISNWDKLTPDDILNTNGASSKIKQDMINNPDAYSSVYFKQTDRAIKAALGWQGDIAGWGEKGDGLSYNAVMVQLQDAIKKDNLKGNDVLIRASEIAEPYIVEHYKTIGQSIDINAMMRKLKGEPFSANTVESVPTKATSKTSASKKQQSDLDPKGIWK